MSNVQSYFRVTKNVFSTLLVTLFLFGLQSLNAQVDIQLCPSGSLTDGGTVTYTVEAQAGATEFNAVSLQINFDPTRLEGTSNIPNGNFTTIQSFTGFDNNAGFYTLEMAILGGTTSGNTTLVTLEFAVTDNGPTEVSLDASTEIQNAGTVPSTLVDDLVLNAISNQSVEEGQTLNVSPSTDDNCGLGLTYSIDIQDGSNNSVSSGDYSFNSSTGALSWTPNVGDADTYSATLTVTNGFSEETETFDIEVTAQPNTSPTITITNPADQSSFDEGTNINFTATASDAEDGSLTANIIWYSSIDDEIGTGGDINVSDLTDGSHTITAEVTDANQATTTDQIEITVNATGPQPFQLCVACGSVGLTAFNRNFVGDPNNAPATGLGFTRTNGKAYKGYSDPIVGTSPGSGEELLFQKEIYGGASGSGGANPSFEYEVPVPNGSYQVDLYFAEVFQDEADLRVFDVALEGALILPDYDMMNQARDGLNSNQTAITRTYQVDVTDGSLTINVGPASADNGKLAGFCVTEIADANLPPTSSIADITIDAEAAASEALNINDPENDNLAVTLSGLPTDGDLAYNASTNQLEGTPTAADAGTYSIDVIVEDGTNSGILDQFELVINPPAGNDPPTIAAVADLFIAEGATANTTVTITDDNNVFGGSIIVYDKSVGNPNSNTIPGGVVAPGDYSFTDGNNDGVYDFSWTTAPGDGRSYRVDVTADDGVNAPVTTTFNIQVGIPLVGTIPAKYFGNPDPWYDSSQPGTGYSVAIESNNNENIGYIDDGDLVDYFVDVPAAGTYDVVIQAAKGTNGTTTVSLEEEDGQGGFTQIGSVGVVNDGGWQSYNPYNTSVSFSQAGLQKLRLSFNGGANILELTFTSQGGGDVTPPVITITGDNPLNWPFGTPYVDPGATATDDTDGDISGDIVTGGDVVDPNNLGGTYSVTYNVSDVAGNAATEAVRTVNITDQDPPVITLTGDPVINLLIGDSYSEQGATATDNVDQNVTVDIDNSAVNTNMEGTYVVTYDAEDAAGNMATQVTRTVNVSTAPNTDVIISATPATQTVDQGQTFTISVDMQANDQSVSATEVILLYDPAILSITQVIPDNSVFSLIVDNGNPGNDTPGTLTFASGKEGPALVNGSIPLFEVTFQAVGSGTTGLDIDFETANSTAITRVLDLETDVLSAVNDATVTINPTIDDTPPAITLLGDNPLNLFLGDTYTDPGATALDDNDGDISGDIVVGGDVVNPNMIGSYFVTYDVDDAAGNSAEQKIREVIVSEEPNTDVIMSVTPDVVTVDQGQNFTVSIDLEANDQEVSVAELFLNYDPAILTIVSITPDLSVFGSELVNDDSQPGLFQYTSGKLGQPFPTGSVPLVDIEFQAIGSGTSALDIDFETVQTTQKSNVLLGANELLTSVNDGTVTVNTNPEITLEAVPMSFTADLGSTATQQGTLTGDASDQSTIPTAISLTDDAAWLTLPATAPQGTPVNFTVDPSGLAAGTYTATITGTANGYQAGTTTVTLQVLGIPEVQVSITPNSSLGASTFSNNSFQIDYLDDGNANIPLPNIQSISFNLSTGILPDMVFDPVGAGGDATSSCFTPNLGATATGLVAPGDPCTDPFSVPRNGGFDVMTINFADFNEGENFEFTTDVDPNNIQGVAGAGNAGAVSGLELAGTKVTITFDNGLVLSGSMFEDGSLGGSTTIGAQPANVPGMPVISTVNGTAPQTVNTTNQTVTVTGDPGSYVGLLQIDSRLFIASGDDPFDVSPAELPFYANEAMAKGLYTAQIGGNGSVDIPVTLQQTPGANNTPDGGLNYFMAVTSNSPYAVGQEASMSSVPLIIKLDLGTPVITLLGDNPLELEVGDTYVEAGATALDQEDGDISVDIVIDATAVNTAVPGSYEVTYNVMDGAGNAATEVIRTVNVSDVNPPVIVLDGDDPVTIPVGGTYTEPGFTATDDVDGDITGNVVVTGGPVTTDAPGTFLLSYNVSDAAGNAAITVTRTVNVTDQDAPVITLLGDDPLEITVGDTYTDPGATATDNVDGDLTGSIVVAGDAVDPNTVGTYVVTYNVSDQAGNAANEVTRTVEVVDVNIPVITLLGDNPLIVAVGSVFTDPGATAFDVEDGDLTNDIVIGGDVVSTAAPATYVITYDVVDDAGNPALQVTRTVQVTDQTAPVIVLDGDDPVTIPVGGTYTEPGFTATDNVDGDITGNVVVTGGPVTTDAPGTFLLSYNVSDAAGNAATTVTRTVNVTDQTAPVITLLGDDPVTIPVGGTYTEPGFTATDNVDGDITGNVIVTGGPVTTDAPGTFLLSYNVSDAAGNAATTVTRTVNVTDQTAPVITLLGDDPLTVAASTPYVDPGATAEDDIDGDISDDIIIDDSDVNVDVPGSYSVTFNVSDAAGNPATEVTRTVIVEDQTAPVITLLGPNPLNLAAGSTYTEPNATAEDNIDGNLTSQIVIDATDVNTAIPGTYEVTYNVSDAAGNAATEVIREVVVTDDGKPVIALVGPATVDLNVGDTYTEQGATAFDNVDGNITAQIIIGGDVVNTSLPGTYVVTYNVSDAAGNAADEVTRTVDVSDVTPPTITLLGDNPVELAVGDTYTEPGFTAIDNVDGDVSGDVQIGGDAVNTNVPGSYVITYNVSDAAGNSATEKTRTVNVTDQTAPVITLNGPNPLTLAAGSTYIEPGATAQDNVDGNISGAIAINNSDLNTNVPGSYEIIYSVSDAAGNTAQEIRPVIVEDQGAPVITLIGMNPLTIPASSPYNDPGAIATDNVDGDISANIVVDDSDVDTDVPGTYQVTYNVMDAAGNPAVQKVRTVIVEDQTAPVITLNGANPLNLAVGDTYNEPGATASDNVDGNISGNIVIDASAVNTAVAGSYSVTYNVSDAAGNAATEVVRTVNVSDEGAPVITLLGDNPLTLEVGDPYVEPGATASDDVDGDISGDIVIDASAVNTNIPGTYGVTYNVMDGAGNAAIEVIRTVNVVDVNAPVITLVGNNPQIIAVGDPYVELGAVAFDDEDGNISGDIVIDASAVNTNMVGMYVVTYNVSDAAGNTANEVTRTVQVTDQTKPVISLTGNNPQIIPLTNAYLELGATATDNVDGDISGLIQIDASNVNTGVAGSYTVTYNVSDAAGNAADEVTRTVEVVDGIIPIITLLGDNPLELAVGDTYIDPGATASDVADGNITDDIVVGGDAVDTGTPGTYVVTYNVQDEAGNAANEVTRDVIVTDQTAPVITLNGPSPLTLQVGSTYVEPGATAEDNVDGNVTGNIVIDNASVNTAVTGSYTVTYSVSDAAGNEAQETRTVVVEDMSSPSITLLGDNPLTVPASIPYNDPGAVAIDNYDGNITANIIVDDTDVDTDVPGSYVVTYNVSDAAGNAASEVTRTVIVEDQTAPVITLNGANPLNLAVGDTYAEPGATALDNVDGDLTGAIIIDATGVNTSVAGSYQVTYNVSDGAGNDATEVIRTVNVSDQGVPSITLLGDNPLTIQAGTPYVEPGATATDDIDGDISGDIVIDASDVDTDEPGEYEVTYNVTDGSGNPAIEVIRTVFVEDMAAPVIGLLGTNPQLVAVGSPYVEAGAVATDDVDGNISGQIVIDASAVNTNAVGDYIVTYNVTDASGNPAAEVTRTVQVRDQEDPVITLIGDNPQIIALDGSYTELGATASDNVDGDISDDIVIDASDVDPNTLGTYTVTYNVTDAGGNSVTEVTRTVEVTDQTLPIITLIGDDPIELDQFAPYNEPGATATDNVDGDISGDIVIDNASVDVTTPGSYTVTYNVTDAAGNAAVEVTRTVNVNDVTPPTIALLGSNPLNLAVGDTYVEAGAIATDDVDGNLNSAIMIDDSDVNMNAPGTYEVVYTVEDAAGNMAMAKRTVNVTDQTGPVITLIGPDPIQVPANNPYVDPGATATDFVDGDVTGNIVIDDSDVDVTTLGTYTVTFNVTDAAGNAAAEVTRTVEVIAPATLLGEITLEANSDQSASDLVLKLYEPGTNTQVGGDYTPESDISGLFSLGDLPFGTYDIYIKKSNFLQVVVTNVTLNSGTNPLVSFPTMLAGDADGDNEVTAFDYDIYITAYGSETGDATFDASTDYNRDGLIFLQDFNLLTNNMNLKGADPEDNE